MLFLILIIATLLCLSTVSAQQPTTPLPPVIVKGVPLPSGAIPDRLRTEEASPTGDRAYSGWRGGRWLQRD